MLGTTYKDRNYLCGKKPNFFGVYIIVPEWREEGLIHLLQSASNCFGFSVEELSGSIFILYIDFRSNY